MEPLSPFAPAYPEPVTGDATANGAGVVRWWIANETGEPLAVDHVRLVSRWRTRGTVRVYSHGYQSWTATGMRRLGHDEDPSRAEASISLVRGVHNADAAISAPGELRSELVTVIADDDGAICIGFDGGARHDGTFRIRAVADGTIEVHAEAFLGGAVVTPGLRRELHALRVDSGDPAPMLERWADWAGAASAARTAAPYQVGWCSWYQYFHAVTEADVRKNLVLAADWPVDVFQLDDGYQSEIGDWLARKDTFPSPLERLATDVAGAGYVPGIWIAPFLASPSSEIAGDHPEWIAHHEPARELIGMVNPGWGGAVWTLDTTHPEVLAHLESLARALVGAGWRYVKLDFTYAPALAGVEWHDPTRTPAERVRAGYDAIRRGAGDDTFVLGCGAPLGACIGAVDGMRIGPDVAPSWEVPHAAWHPPGYQDCEPSTLNALRNTVTRAFQHRRLWLNDPDCLMLRADDTELTSEQMRTWARTVAASGGMALISDDLALLGPSARALLDDVLDLGRVADDLARAGRTPRAADLLETYTPTQLSSAASTGA